MIAPLAISAATLTEFSAARADSAAEVVTRCCIPEDREGQCVVDIRVRNRDRAVDLRDILRVAITDDLNDIAWVGRCIDHRAVVGAEDSNRDRLRRAVGEASLET